MTQPENITPDRTDLMQTIQRCAEAYHVVRAQLKEDAIYFEDQENQHKAFLAFGAHLPILCDLASMQVYIACISQGAAIGAIDPVDVGRFCHIANTAMAAWKLANLTVPAAQERERRAQKKEQEESERQAGNQTPLPSKGNQSDKNGPQSEAKTAPSATSKPPAAPKNPTPHPPKGNQAEDKPRNLESLYAATKLPDWETQKALFFTLRKRGVEIPTDDELFADPAQALHYVETARWYLRSENVSSAAPSPAPQSAPAQQKPSNQAA